MLVFQPLKKYADFSGRAGRKEFWLFNLLFAFLGIVFSWIDALLVISGTSPWQTSFLTYIFIFAFFIPMIAVAVRRLHDTNRKGWWLLIYLIPVIGQIWLLVLMCFRSNREDNRFGGNPITQVN
jgi:uncharacterized membrane protein YhaH (DUF805 family)